MSDRLCPSPWRPVVNEWERENRAAVLDRPRPATLADAARLTAGPTGRLLRVTGRHLRAAVLALWAAGCAASTTYRESINGNA